MRTFREAIEFKGPVRISGGLEFAAHREGGDAGGGSLELASGVSATFDRLLVPRHVRLTLTGFEVTVLADDDYGGAKLLDLPDSNLLMLAVEPNLVATKGNVSGGFEAAKAATVGIGTAIASASTLSGAMVDVLSGTALPTGALTAAYGVHSSSDGSLSYPVRVADSPTGALYLNVAASLTADDVLTIAGTIDLVFLDLGNVTS